MNMEESKTEVLIVNGSQSMIKSPTGDISPKASIEFLGYHVQNNLKIEKTVNTLISKINKESAEYGSSPTFRRNVKSCYTMQLYRAC